MPRVRVLWQVILLVLIATTACASNLGLAKELPWKSRFYAPGERFCPSDGLISGSVIIAPGQCYIFFLMRDKRGTFLAFSAPGAETGPRKTIRLADPAGAKIKSRIIYFVPIHAPARLVRMDTIKLVAVQVDESGPELAISLVGVSARTVAARFTVLPSQPPGATLVLFAIVNQTGAIIRVRVLADGQELFVRRLEAEVSHTPMEVPPVGQYPMIELKVPMSMQARELQVEEVAYLRIHKVFDVTGFHRTGAGFRIVIRQDGIGVSQDYYPVR